MRAARAAVERKPHPDDESGAAGWRTAAQAGMAHAAGVPALVLMASMVGVGGLARDVGFPLWAAMVSTVLIWAGPAQVVFFGSIAAGATLTAVAFAVCLSSIRFVPMGVSLIPLLRTTRTRRWHLLLAVHFVAVTVWVEGLRRLPHVPRPDRMPYFLAFSATVMAAATVATGAGYFLIGALPKPLAAGLLFMTPIYFTTSLARNARSAGDWAALSLGFALTPLAGAFLLSGVDLMVVGLAAGAVAYGIDARVRQA